MHFAMLQSSVNFEMPDKSASMNMMVPSAPAKKRTFDEANLDAKPSGDNSCSDKLPKKLRDMFLPLTCKLCKVTATSNMMAKAHYTGKPHEKRVRQFLEKWSEETGNPMPKISKPETKLSQDASYCKTCDIILTSVSVAQQHYAGKNHYKAFTQGKKHKAQTVVEVNDGRFGIGTAFLPNVATESVHQLPSDDTSIESPIKHRMQPVESKSNRLANDIKKKLFSWSCDLCGVIAHSEDQLNMHLKGAKHLKAIKRSQTPSIIPAPANPSESILASVIHPEKNVTDYSMFRTPSGHYYCQPCNVSVNSPEQMSQHVESKKHKFKYACSKSKKAEFNGNKIPVEKNHSNPPSALSDKV